MSSLPKRCTDGAFCVDEVQRLRGVALSRGEHKRVRREKGVERQYRLDCAGCGAAVAYRPKPFDESTRFLYVEKDAVVAGEREAELGAAKAAGGGVGALGASSNQTKWGRGGEREFMAREMAKVRAGR